MLINAVSSLKQLGEYWVGIKNGIIVDLQPIRDLSYFLDIRLIEIFKIYSFHLTNLITWIAICYMFYGILTRETRNKYIPILLLFLYCFSPVSTSSVAWIAARKHLLSTLFILIPTYLVVKKKKEFFTLSNTISVIIFYLLSCFSQPINVLWPIWFFFYTYSFKDIPRKFFIINALFLIMLLVLGANYFYYSSPIFNNVSVIGKFISKDVFNLGTLILALGRYFFQCFFPFLALPTSHYQGALENLIGFFGLIIFIFFIFLKSLEDKKSIALAVLYFILPLLVVSLKTTNIFCSDTYLLNASVGFYWAIAILFENIEKKKIIYLLLSMYCVFIFHYNLNYVDIFSNEKELWRYSYEKEANSHSTMIVALQNVKENNFKQAYNLIDELQQKWPDQPFIPQLISESIFFNKTINITKKIEVIEKISPQTSSTHFYLTILYARQNELQNLKNHIVKIFDDSKKFKMEFMGREEKVAAIYSYTCTCFLLESCFQIKSLKEHINKINFNDKVYNDYLKYLLTSPLYRVELQVK